VQQTQQTDRQTDTIYQFYLLCRKLYTVNSARVECVLYTDWLFKSGAVLLRLLLNNTKYGLIVAAGYCCFIVPWQSATPESHAVCCTFSRQLRSFLWCRGKSVCMHKLHCWWHCTYKLCIVNLWVVFMTVWQHIDVFCRIPYHRYPSYDSIESYIVCCYGTFVSFFSVCTVIHLVCCDYMFTTSNFSVTVHSNSL